MASKFTMTDAKLKIKELEALVEDAKLKQDDNVYDVTEQKFIKFYQYGFFILLALNILQLIF